MAGDWIKMRTDLSDDPAVIAIAARCGLDEDQVVGKLHRFWSWADRQTTDGNASGVTAAWLDRLVRVTGFATAMEESGWLVQTDSGLQIPNFERQNGETAKKRALTAKRVAKHKAGNADTNAQSASSVTQSALPREEKRREEQTQPSAVNGEEKPTRSSSEKRKGGIERAQDVPIPTELSTDRFREVWADWIKHRTSRSPKWTANAALVTLKRLTRVPIDQAIELVERATAGGWQGVNFDSNPRPGPAGRRFGAPTPDDAEFYAGLNAFAEKEMASSDH